MSLMIFREPVYKKVAGEDRPNFIAIVCKNKHLERAKPQAVRCIIASYRPKRKVRRIA